MKKLPLLISFLISTVTLFASQRLVMVEEFTNASCPPCAAQNPGFNTLLQANPTKIVALKYQTNWPGVDPMNAQTQSLGVATRVSYYGVDGVPMARIDGDTMLLLTGGYYTGAPHNLDQTKINTEYALSSPFAMNLSHSFSANYDSVYITLDITCTQAVTGTNLRCRVALTESQIDFCAAPGTNGETEFSNVMRAMYPDVNGTILSNSWTVGQMQTITFTKALPAYIYDKNQIAVVAFIQDDGNKVIHQAALSTPHQLPLDAGLFDCAAASSVICNSSVSPSVMLTNYGSSTLTSATINWQINGGSVSSQPWSGTLAPGASTSVSLPSMTLPSSSNTVHLYSSLPNGSGDYNTGNDNRNLSVTVLPAPSISPVSQNFSIATYPPTGWNRQNVDGDTYQWARAAASNGGTGSSTINFYNAAVGTVDNLYTPVMDFTWVGPTASTLTFDVAYAQYTTENDRLQVNVSTDCGANWTNVYNKAGSTLSTSAATTSSFTPTLASQWRNESVDMSAFAGQPSVLVQFQATSAYGNNLYVDNINMSALTNVNDLNNVNNMDVYPNPSNGNFNVKFDFMKAEDVTVTVTNLIGEVVRTLNFQNVSSGSYPIDMTSEAKGNYFVNIKTAGGTVTKRISITQ
jgi:hypothetical protein